MINPLFRTGIFFRRLKMNILKSIGAFFTRIWRGIKETAWVQPLLIVGAIFAVIFAIPRVTSWVQSFGVGTTTAYYMGAKQTLEGETNDDKVSTEADKITASINQWSHFSDSEGYAEQTTYEEYRAAMDSYYAEHTDEKSPIEKYGEKFYLIYVGRDCSACEEAQPGFETLQENWGGRYVAEDGRDFKFYTIYQDEVSSNDDDYDTDDDKKAFVRYLEKFEDLGFWSNAGTRLSDRTPYRANAGLEGSSNYDYFTTANHTNFQTPTILLIDFSEEAFNLKHSRVGVSEVLFGVSGTTNYDKASLLLSMWNHTTTSDITNKFSDVYVK